MQGWPALEYSAWKDTYETLHRWLQIVGKLRMCKAPLLNHSWSTTFYVSSRGFTTGSIPLGERILSIEFDFIDHLLVFQDSENRNYVVPLINESVATFYARFCEALKAMDVKPTYGPVPNELMDSIPFAEDTQHRTYHPQEAFNAWQVFLRVNNAFEDFRADFIGKSSPVHLFWGGFDLAITRFSGRRAPEHPGGIPHLNDKVVREAYSHEVISCGFWPGNEMYPEAAFYSYAYPEPEKFSKHNFSSIEVFYHPDLHEFILPYERIRTNPNPAKEIKTFMEESYQLAASLAGWNTEEMNVGPELIKLREADQVYFVDGAIKQ